MLVACMGGVAYACMGGVAYACMGDPAHVETIQRW